MKYRIFACLLAGLILVLPFLSLTTAQEENLAQWYARWYTSDGRWFGELNNRASAAYAQITGTPRSIQELMNRNRFYWFWPDFESAVRSMWPDYALECVNGQSSTYNGAHVQSLYIDTDDYRSIISTVFHENIHSDAIDGNMSDALYFGAENLWSNGFELYDGRFEYFDEAFVEILSDLVMREAGFADYSDGGYGAGTAVLRPMIEKIMARGVTVRDLYDTHTRSDVEEILLWIGMVYVQENGIAYNPDWDEPSRELAVSYGYQFALEVNQAQEIVIYPPQEEVAVETTPEAAPTEETEVQAEPTAVVEITPPVPTRATCGMWLWFSPAQYELYMRAYDFPPDVWYQNEWGNWRIVEEDYYAVIDSQ